MKAAAPPAGVGRGIAWALASQVGRQLIVFVTTIVLARLLTPADFGLIGMATVFTGFAMIINDVGVSGALVQRQQIDERHLSSMFWLNQIVGLALCGLTNLLAPVISAFFDAPELAAVLRVLSLLFVAGALGIVQQAVLVRAIDFRRLGLVETAAVLLAGGIAIALAAAGFGVWSLVLQLVLMPALTTAGLWLSSDWRPRWCFDRGALGELVPFGLNMAGFNSVNYLARNLDYLFVGKFLGATSLGYYTLAYRLMVYPLQAVSTAVARVSFPALSRTAENREMLIEGFLKMTKGVSIVTFPMVLGIFAVAPSFVEVVYGRDWLVTADLLRILCAAGLVQSVGTTVGAVYQSIGRPDIQLRMSLLNTTLTAIALWIGLRWGLSGVALAYSTLAVVWVHFSMFVVTRIIGLSFRRMYVRFALPLTCSVAMAGLVFALEALLPGPAPWTLALEMVTGAAAYGLLMTLSGQIRWRGRRPALAI
ncbi:MAG: MOP flippase family protein [Rhodocyclaceae bacterium]|nr:MOP flippase family protein [Rhodocyclaceae bacterium]